MTIFSLELYHNLMQNSIKIKLKFCLARSPGFVLTALGLRQQTYDLKGGSFVPVKTELDGKRYHSIYVHHKNKWINPQMELALSLLEEYVGVDTEITCTRYTVMLLLRKSPHLFKGSMVLTGRERNL